MSDTEVEAEDGSLLPGGSTGGRRRAESSRRGLPGCLAVLVVLAVLGALVYFGATRGVDAIRDQFTDPEDYPGPGTGKVTFEVVTGDTSTDIGRNLEDQDVVASAEAFRDTARADPDSTGIQPGFYPLRKQMSSEDALAVLVDPDNAIRAGVTIPEGFRVGQIVDRIAEQTDFKKAVLQTLVDKPGQIGLPAEADGNVEGYLYPARYEVTPGMTAKDLLSQMVAKTVAVEKELKIAARADALGLTPHELITVASILEYEGNNPEDYAKVARVIYNRLDQGMLLQFDSTVSYIFPENDSVFTTAEQRESDSPYNTYKFPGLPPGPIGAPGEVSIEAALNPADGDWLYFVPDYENDTTLFTASYDEHLQNVARLKEYCRTHEC